MYRVQPFHKPEEENGYLSKMMAREALNTQETARQNGKPPRRDLNKFRGCMIGGAVGDVGAEGKVCRVGLCHFVLILCKIRHSWRILQKIVYLCANNPKTLVYD